VTIQEIQRLRERKPFKPFRVLTADGRAYDVIHPVLLAQSASGRLGLLLVAGIHKGIKPGKNGSRRKM
jgi:hypothetical protein